MNWLRAVLTRRELRRCEQEIALLDRRMTHDDPMQKIGLEVHRSYLRRRLAELQQQQPARRSPA